MNQKTFETHTDYRCGITKSKTKNNFFCLIQKGKSYNNNNNNNDKNNNNLGIRSMLSNLEVCDVLNTIFHNIIKETKSYPNSFSAPFSSIHTVIMNYVKCKSLRVFRTIQR